MTRTLKKSLGLMAVLMLVAVVAATSVLAATRGYEFYFEGDPDPHSSGFIVGDADITNGVVTITLAGNYFPELYLPNDPEEEYYYDGIYDSGSGTTSISFPGDDSEDIPIELHVVVPFVHNEWFELTIVWDE